MARGTREQRGYGAAHQKARAALALTLPASCGYGCGTVLWPGSRWVAAHRVDGDPSAGWLASCAPCNERAKVRTSPRPVIPGREVVALMGAPGSGKSTWAGRFPNRITTDALRMASRDASGRLTDELVDRVYTEAFDGLAAALRANLRVVFDSPLVNPLVRQRVLRVAHGFRATATLVVFDTPADVCVARQAGRANPVPEDIVRQMHAAIAAALPDVAGEGWTAVVHV